MEEEKQTPMMIEYVVVKGPVANRQGEVFQTGNTILLAEGDSLAGAMIAEGMIHLKVEMPKYASTTAPSVPNAPTEPRKRYRGHVVVTEGIRSVGNQQFHHIRIADGSELDLTDDEYQNEVKISYPPSKR